MTVSPLIILKAFLSDREDDIEIIAGPSISIEPIRQAMDQSPAIKYEIITKEEAKEHLLKDGYTGAGIYIEDTIDVIEDNRRMLEAFDLLLYISARLQNGSVHIPVGI